MARRANVLLPVTGALIASVLVLGGTQLGPPTAQIPSCSDAADFSCHRDRYHAIVHARGIEAAFEAIKADYLASDAVRSMCHQLTHAIAHGVVHGAGATPPSGEGEHFCGSGYYSGTVEAYVANRDVLSSPGLVCAGPRARAPRSNHHANCAHALGHGLMARLGGRLSRALKACDLLVDGWERDRCYAGVFMDNISGAAARGGTPSRSLTPRRPLAPCTDVADRYRAPCYRQQPAYGLYVHRGDFAAVFRLCEAVAERPYRIACAEGLGVNAAATSLADRITMTGAAAATDVLCSLAHTAEVASSCIVGAVKQFVDHHRTARAGDVFCAAVPARFGRDCRTAGRAYDSTL